MKRGPARAERAAMCGATRRAKIRYKTLKDAKLARAARVDHGEAYLRVYKCRVCRGYHLTSQVARMPGTTVWAEPVHGLPMAA